jgi:glycosyltransferase involved in cell wall biosynthesis
MKKILFLSKDNLTTNPRLQKELKLAVEQGCIVDFIGFYSGNWSDKINKKITKKINANFHYISAIRKPFLKWFLSSIIEKTAQKIYPFFKNNLIITAFAHSKRTFLLQQHLKKNNKKYDLIIAHTLPTLYPAYRLAQKLSSKFTFDIEDYHPGEAISNDNKNEITRRKFLMKKLLSSTCFITYASPLIGEYSLKLLNNYPDKQHKLINNCFSRTEFQFRKNDSEKIKFVWFSQNISAGRGLELLVPVLAKFKDKIELHLIGNLYQTFYDSFLLKYTDFVKIISPLSQRELNLKLSEFDIGLSIELNTADINRQICLTNKIWAYAQSGLYILATDTNAQIQFMQKHENIGLISKQNNESLSTSCENIIKNINEIRYNKKTRFDYIQNLSWENESRKLVDIWNIIL